MRKQPQSRDSVISNVHRLVTRAALLSLTASLAFAAPLPAQARKAGNLEPTALAGESWLTHLQRSFDETSMGKTGQLGPPGTTTGEGNGERKDGAKTAADDLAHGPLYWRQDPGSEALENGTVVLHGSDLYRMNCRGCHGENGAGAPPEINSVINPVRATSTAAVMERMKIAGMNMSRADAVKLAEQSKTMLLDRLHHGGQDMPSFPHLSGAEVTSLIAYLRQLAGIHGADREQLAVREERVRVGEHIAKSTCHICHSAAGPNPTSQQLYDGAIPPLSTLAGRTTQAEFIRKVTRGAPIVMGTPPQLLRGRMPVFYYVSEDEAADIYLYLTRYPPYQRPVIDPAIASSRPAPDATEKALARPAPAESVVPGSGLARGQTSTATADKYAQLAFPMLAGLCVVLLLGSGLGFTVYELRRLSATNKVVIIRKIAIRPSTDETTFRTGRTRGSAISREAVL
jgi:mono/diheme cytochrome c family protein